MAEGIPSRDLERYFAEARSWDQDRIRSAYRSRKLAWIVAGIAGTLATAAVAAVVALAPLKTVEPFVITVDRTTGATQVATAITGEKPLSYDEAVSKFFLAQYVRAREGWIPAAARENFNSVAILSDPNEQARWQRAFDATNPASPQTMFGARASAQVTVRSITFVNPKIAQVRFTRMVQPDLGDAVSTNWIATISFSYSAAPMAEGDRFRNPLGFQVSSYRADPEAIQ
ncbi:virB8 family protein [Sphingomonas crocodyli]|uniref:VirB8 family protein n=1 Tax=Sphingomonas crocodyli TaxID=1979270 RepID=A0A437LY48_9SPHN|nr:VirB8/TrbF family protein [Sphingomonas crocodyli]RVT90297.1 virB8 family protein [Sphingomonas crocodyli]